MSHKIVFFGNERLATGVETNAPVLQSLIAAGYDVRAVVTQHEHGKSRKPRELEIAAVAARHNIPVLLPNKMSDIADDLKAMQAEAGVLIAFGKIVPQSIIDIFQRGIVNIHPSDLPKHRGPTPLESVILAGDEQTAVSLMSLGAKMDAGPIYAQQAVALTGKETKQQLADTLLGIGQQLLIQHLPAILGGAMAPTPQDDTEATYDSLITKDAGVINWQSSAVEIECQIRAYASWPKSRAEIGGRDVVITAAHVLPEASGVPGVIWLHEREIGMHTGDGVLVIDQLVPAGKKPMSGSDFLLGYKPV
ncbi:methionyl-tRNA formyltransferase [soil metagenome]